MYTLDRLEQYPPIWTVVDDYLLFAQAEVSRERKFARMLDYLDMIVKVPVPFSARFGQHEPVAEPSALFWSQASPPIVTAPCTTPVEGMRTSPSFSSLTYGIDPSEFKPFTPPTCPVPFGSPFTAASDLDSDTGSTFFGSPCDSGYESDVSAQPETCASDAFSRPPMVSSSPSPVAHRCTPVASSCVRLSRLDGGVQPPLSAKALGKRRAVPDEDEHLPRKRVRSDDSDGYCFSDEEDTLRSRNRDTRIPHARHRVTTAGSAPREKRYRCIYRKCNDGRPGFCTVRDRDRHMDKHAPGRFLCPNPACERRFHRLDALQRHCESVTLDCKDFKHFIDTRKDEEGKEKERFCYTCPLEELIKPGPSDPLYRRWV